MSPSLARLCDTAPGRGRTFQTQQEGGQMSPQALCQCAQQSATYRWPPLVGNGLRAVNQIEPILFVLLLQKLPPLLKVLDARSLLLGLRKQEPTTVIYQADLIESLCQINIGHLFVDLTSIASLSLS